MDGVFTASHSPEQCAACGALIPAGDTYVITGVVQGTTVRHWHLDCHPADVRVLRLRRCAE